MKINSLSFYKKYYKLIPELELDEENPDVYIIYSDYEIIPLVFGFIHNNEKFNPEVSESIYKVTKHLVNKLNDFFDKHDGKSALICNSAVFLLIDYLIPSNNYSICEVNEHRIPHNIKCLETKNNYTIESKHDFLIDSRYLIPKFICDPAVSTKIKYLIGSSMIEEISNEVEIFSHVFKSITFCIPDLLTANNNKNLFEEVLTITKNHRIHE
jgi:hypothetical protein